MVARSVRCRSGASRRPPVRTGRARSSRASNWSGGSTRVRAAANSIASGRPSSRRQISSTAAAGSVTKARSRNSSIGVGRRQREDRELAFAIDPQGRPGGDQQPQVRAGADEAASEDAAAGSNCSRLSRRMSIRFSSMCSTRPCWAPIAAAIVGSMSCASVTAAKGTQKTPPVNRSTDSAAAWRASRVLPEPPAPVKVTMRASSMSAAMSRSSSVRPTSGSSWAGRFVALRERSGGNRSEPSWNSLSGAPRSLSRCSPRSRPGSRSSAARVTSESTTCPPWAAAQILAARWTSMPTYPSS